MASLRLAALVLVATGLLAASPTLVAAATWAGVDSSLFQEYANNNGCGSLNDTCCHAYFGEDLSYFQFCSSPDLFCNLDATSPEFETCVPVPEDCGWLGAGCCPGYGPRCREPDLVCRVTDADAYSHNQAGALSCQPVSPEGCGTAAAPCAGLPGTWLPPPAPQCPADKQQCPKGYYCVRDKGNVGNLGGCFPVPEACGREGGECCPAGLYGDGRNASAVFCTDPGIHCIATTSTDSYYVIQQAHCARWPRFPEECGALGGPCCYPFPKMPWLEDSDPPPNCLEGLDCKYTADNSTCLFDWQVND